MKESTSESMKQLFYMSGRVFVYAGQLDTSCIVV